MQTIYYPGSAGDPPQYIEPEEPEELQEPIFSLPPVPPTTTPYPIIVETRRPIPARPVIPTAPIEPVSIPRATIRAPPRRRRPQAPVQTRFESHSDIPVVENIENTEPLAEDDDEEARIFRQQQAENAHYTFDTSIDDTINDHAIQRQETRNGLSLKGMYSYSDGFFKRTIHYEADKNGYRVVKWVFFSFSEFRRGLVFASRLLNRLWTRAFSVLFSGKKSSQSVRGHSTIRMEEPMCPRRYTAIKTSTQSPPMTLCAVGTHLHRKRLHIVSVIASNFTLVESSSDKWQTK